MNAALRGSENGYSFIITNEGSNKYFTFVTNNVSFTIQYYSYGVTPTLQKLYDIIGKQEEVKE